MTITAPRRGGSAHAAPGTTAGTAPFTVLAPTVEQPYWQLLGTGERVDLASVLAGRNDPSRQRIEHTHAAAIATLAEATAALDPLTAFPERRRLSAAIASLALKLGGIRPGHSPRR